ncbi:hypothetical protein A4G99_18050 [Haladaptatus sp. R4]|uniref:hypothetical protein n=1 Tax=Haladaptatus sp. R4 TaxID=1679489 RepID=UPI0007B4E755|nr:hypothetical protein [Haladaptatus sp. R4]KZN22683.1 hypothetical protein A4G99_18050 [Haladaptatus sp. R4]
MGLRDHAHEVANDAKERTMTAARRARGVGGTVARKTADTGSEAGGEALRTVRETAESVRGRVDGSEGVEAIPKPSVVAETTGQATTALTVEIRQFLDEVDHRYAAKSAFNGARQGYAAGPYGAVLGAGAGTVYGAYNSTQGHLRSGSRKPERRHRRRAVSGRRRTREDGIRGRQAVWDEGKGRRSGHRCWRLGSPVGSRAVPDRTGRRTLVPVRRFDIAPDHRRDFREEAITESANTLRTDDGQDGDSSAYEVIFGR